MKNRYTLQRDDYGTWISLPNNGGDVGDMSDIVEELNHLLYQNEKLWNVIGDLNAKLYQNEKLWNVIGDLKAKLNIIVEDLEQHTK